MSMIDCEEWVNKQIASIRMLSPDVPGYGGGQWAMYSIGCCWWTSYPEDLGETPPFKVTQDPTTGVFQVDKDPNGHGLPCCPHCGSLLMQAPLEKFIESAKADPGHYGEQGLSNFVKAHSQYSKFCRKGWDQYSVIPNGGRFA